MGDIADMMLDGILDEQTGEYIDDKLSRNGGPGYPRTMEPGHYNSIKGTSKNAPKSLNGIYKYMRKYTYKAKDVHKIMNRYCKSIGIEGSIKEKAVEIQKDFSDFKKYVDNHYKTK